ncbi:unnamed protein product [Moneuplotes crassus]|uniref:non-specific serine/threonine protein kinase n=1 Tax=Euplotes crassus TaxID=5936 RepID=A0AAD1X517_EUPCR|nr:unnamed protein product [Moneuplotes crassus]
MNVLRCIYRQKKRFKIIKRLGSGAFSDVYKVKKIAGADMSSEFYALKKVKLDELGETEKQNALNEVRILASLEHDNIIAYKDAFIDHKENVLYIVMEFAEKGDLQSIITKNKKSTILTEDRIWSYTIQMVRGLYALHQQGIGHRDLKPANVFITQDGVLKLGDMNVSKIAQCGLMKTQTGTPYYCAPEIWKGQQYDFKSDIWSLGCVVYEMAMKKPPFTALNIQELSHKACKGIFPALTSAFSTTLRDLVKNMLKVMPTQRLSSSDIMEMEELETKLTNTCKNLDPESKNHGLLGTIKMPKKLQDLAGRLPRPKYSKLGLKRMNSEPCRLPSVNSRSRAGSASSRKKWDFEKSEMNKFIPKSVVSSKKLEKDFHLMKQQPHSGRYFRQDSIDRRVLQRAASNLVSRGNSRRSIDISKRSDSNNSRRHEEQKAPVERRRWGMPPIASKQPSGMSNQQPSKPPLAMGRPPLQNMNMNSNSRVGYGSNQPCYNRRDNYHMGSYARGSPRGNSPGLFRFQ